MAPTECDGPAIGWEVLESNPHLLQPGDIVHLRWSGFPWCLVRRGTQSPGEGPTWANHSALIVANNPAILLIEALITVTIRQVNRYRYPPWYLWWMGKCQMVVQRRRCGLSPGIRRGIAAKALDYQGRVFGVGKVLLHALDFLIGDRYVFRRLARMDRYPICSWIVAYAYYRLIGLRFCHKPPSATSPDDIADHCGDTRCGGVWRLVWADSDSTLQHFREFYPQVQPIECNVSG